MPKIIDHEQRKVSILRAAFRLFAENGYQNTSLSQLAEVCRISRPTLYLYFRDKEEIFTYAVKYYTDKMFSSYKNALNHTGSMLAQIQRFTSDIVLRCWYSRDFITSLGDFVVQKRRDDLNFPTEIRRRTVKLDHLIRRMLRQGIKNGEIRPVPVEETALNIMDLVQAYMFRLAILNMVDPKNTLQVLEAFLEGLRKN